MEPTEDVKPVPYECDECDMVIAFYPGFVMTHAGRDRHAFTLKGGDD